MIPPVLSVRLRRNILVLSLGALALLCSSCSKHEKVYPVRGLVRYQGKPLPRALVALHPIDDPNKPLRPLGYAGADGWYALTTFKSKDGAPAGEYAVTVEWRPPPRSEDDGPQPSQLPARYSKPETSGLRVRIDADVQELPPLDLKR
jgi:hypothetical protein